MIVFVIFIQLLVPLVLLCLLFYWRWRIRWKLLQRYESKISGKIDVSEKYNGEKVLSTNSFVQGVSTEKESIKKSYWYKVAVEIVRHCKAKKKPTVLFIGLGANTSSTLVEQMNSRIHQVIVEIDPFVIQACRDYFNLDEMKTVEVLQGDIVEFLKKKKNTWKKAFDVIVIDTFDAQPPYLMNGSHDPAFLNQLVPWLKADGMFLFNIPVRTRGIRVPELKAYLRSVFESVHEEIIRDPRGYRNYVIRGEGVT